MRLQGGEPPSDSGNALEGRAFEASEIPQMLLNAEGVVTDVNQRARVLFALTGGEIGRPIQDLELSTRPVDLLPLIDRAAQDGRPTAARRVEWVRGHEPSFFDVHVIPLLSDTGALLGTGIMFRDVTDLHELEEQLRRSQREVEAAYEELQSTVQELETTNEKLRSTNAELETVNEQLRSTNDELEATNAELQSTNAELETMNEELRRRSAHS